MSSPSLLSTLKDIVPVLSVVVIGIAGISNGVVAWAFGFSYFRYASIADHTEGVIGVSVALILSVVLFTMWKWARLVLKKFGGERRKEKKKHEITRQENLIKDLKSQISRAESAVRFAENVKSSNAKPDPLATQELEAAKEELKTATARLPHAESGLQRLQREFGVAEKEVAENKKALKNHAYVDFMGWLSRERPAFMLFALTLFFALFIAFLRSAAIGIEPYAYLSADGMKRGCYKVALRLERVTFLLHDENATYAEARSCADTGDIVAQKFKDFMNAPLKATVSVVAFRFVSAHSSRYVVPTDSIHIFQSATYIDEPPSEDALVAELSEIAGAIRNLTLPDAEPSVRDRVEEGLIGGRLTPDQLKPGQVYWRGFEVGEYGLPPLLVREDDQPTEVEILEAASSAQLSDSGLWYFDRMGNLSQQFSTNSDKWSDEALLDMIVETKSRHRRSGDKEDVIDVQILGFADGRGSYPLNAVLSHYRAVVVESVLKRIAKERGYEKKFRFFHCYAGSSWEGAIKDSPQAYQNPWLRRVELRIDDAIFDDERACQPRMARASPA